MPSRLTKRLSAARRHQFVGRATELELFRSALTEIEPPFFVLHVYGPGGVGKTSLLREFTQICEQTQTHALYLDARDTEATPDAFLKTLQIAMGLDASTSALTFLAEQEQRYVLLIDTYEVLTPLDRWLRQDFLPHLSDHILTVLAGKNPPALAWKTDPGWLALTQTIPLRNLSTDESRTYLTKHHIPLEQHQPILDFTHGHPLALSLTIDTFAQRQHTLNNMQPEAAPDMIKALLARLVQKVPGPAHRTALEACAIVRITTETLLAEMLAMPESSAGQGFHELFEWLRDLSFIEATFEGLFPHDLVRESLVADLRWRNPEWYTELHRRARMYYSSRLPQASGQVQQRILSDYVFLHRDNAMVKPFFEWQSGNNALPDVLHPTDHEILLGMVAHHEGDASADIAKYWFTRQPEGVLVFRGTNGKPAGMMAMVALQQLTPQDSQIDPAIHSVTNYLQQHAALRPGETATLFRFWLAKESYQAVSAIQSLIFLNAVRHYLTTPDLAFTFFPCADPDFWAMMFAYADLTRLPQADFEIGGCRYGMYGHDWRAMPPMTWLSLLAEREVAAQAKVTAPATVPNMVVLSQPDFEQAIREALRHMTRPNNLATSPLLRSRVVLNRVEATAANPERVEALQRLLQENAELLQASPRDVKLYRALYHTYFQPALNQEQAAELIDVPFSTYRRYLKAGTKRVAETLWQQELGNFKK